MTGALLRVHEAMRRCAAVASPLTAGVALPWALWHERRILRKGRPLSAAELSVARALGVTEPEQVRLMVVPVLPLPGALLWQRWANHPGSLAAPAEPALPTRGWRWRRREKPKAPRWWAGVSAITLGHGIYCIGEPPSQQLLAHELWHVRQVERSGSLRAFLALYLAQVARHGYWHAPLEVEAREAAQHYGRYSEVAGAPFSAR